MFLPIPNHLACNAEVRSEDILSFIDIAGKKSFHFRTHLLEGDLHCAHSLRRIDRKIRHLFKGNTDAGSGGNDALHPFNKILGCRYRLQSKNLDALHQLFGNLLGSGKFL